MDYEKFLLFGDSITEFAFNTRPTEDGKDQYALGAALVNEYTRKMDILQRGFKGYTSRWALKILSEILKHESNIVMATIFLGANDACSAGPQSVPLPEFIDNIRQMVSLMKSYHIRPIIIGPGLVDREKWEKEKSEEIALGYFRTNENFAIYSDALAKLANEENVPFVALNKAFQQEGGDAWQQLLTDGLHFSGKGYKIFHDELLKVIETFYPQYHPKNMQYKLKDWRDVLDDGSNIMS
ncbi:AVN_HP_G0046560.mRNA.1.CDS.1 [Saccharomyces cerevisiae]|nr:AVN_HP_G0146340.mRNA.1.CDS.1 [Saccharomyces cerevisiae]CAI5003909.1 AVN_HP_G0046560.mRNA.1.CDS.1 [Saccharomyces cerevisiae]CAI6517943.1 AVN_HP_G0146340.mRNA.1.CDS.1 [Saccharomyces cerevisiae]CAI6915646.1 AVN_HP_G0046560.mRNA.1.CDS.1 [Saccharomyces cerevisiae]